MAKITVPAMGAKGVNVDAMPNLLDDAELQQSQNAYHEPEAGHGGALVIRKGFDHFHFEGIGPVLGGKSLAVASNAGATGGGPLPTFPTTSGSDTGSPGGPSGPTGTPTGSGPFNPTGPLFSGARVIAIGRISTGSNTNAVGNKWILCSKGFADTPIAITGPINPPSAYLLNGALDGPPSFQGGSPMYGAIHDGWCYYVGRNHDDAGTGNVSTVRRVSATKDEAFCSIPTKVGTNDSAIVSMLAAQDYIWVVSCAASGSAHGGEFGRAWRLDPKSKSMQELNWATYGDETFTGSTAGNTYFPYSMEMYNDRLYVGSWCDASGAERSALVYTEHPTGASGALITGSQWTFSLTPFQSISALKAHSGSLFMGWHCLASGSNEAFAPLDMFTETVTGSALTTVLTPLDGTGGTGALNNNRWTSIVEFNGALFAAWHNPADVSRIYMSTGGGASGTWSSEFELLTTNSRPLWLFVDDGVLYVIGLGTISTNNAKILSSTSGLSGSYTDVSNAWSGAGVMSAVNQPFPLLFGFDQE